MPATRRDSSLPFQSDFSASELAGRRRRVLSELGGTGLAVMAGAPEVAGFDPIRQDNDFYYLTANLWGLADFC